MPYKKPIYKRWWFWTIIAVFVLPFSILFIDALYHVIDQDYASADFTSTPGIAIEATGGPTPDLTPAPSPMPAPAEEPSPTPENPMDELSAEYISFITETAENIAQNLIKYNDQNIALLGDVTLLYDDNWKTETFACIGLIQNDCQSIVDYDTSLIPEDFLEMHEEYKTGCHLYIQALDKYMEGIDTMDNSLLAEAVNLVIEGSVHISNAGSYIE